MSSSALGRIRRSFAATKRLSCAIDSIDVPTLLSSLSILLQSRHRNTSLLVMMNILQCLGSGSLTPSQILVSSARIRLSFQRLLKIFQQRKKYLMSLVGSNQFINSIYRRRVLRSAPFLWLTDLHAYQDNRYQPYECNHEDWNCCGIQSFV